MSGSGLLLLVASVCLLAAAAAAAANQARLLSLRRHALRHGDLKLLRWLVAAGADVLAANGDGEGELGLQADPLLRLVWDDLMEEARCGSLPAVVLPTLGSLFAG